jgi:ABC-type branched-subunit amino acid transport system ATPase component
MGHGRAIQRIASASWIDESALKQVFDSYVPHIRRSQEMTTAPLSFAGVTVRFGGRIGAAKTTAFQCVLGLRKADAGRALLFDRDAWRHQGSAMARLGVDDPSVAA